LKDEIENKQNLYKIVNTKNKKLKKQGLKLKYQQLKWQNCNFRERREIIKEKKV